MNTEVIHSYLRKIQPTGAQGFEGLIAELLEILTGRHFFLAKSGYQAGRDMSASSPGDNKIAVECKRYLESTPLDEREILGELVQVTSTIPDLDLWVLIASRKVDSHLENSVRLFASEKGFEILIIDTTEIAGGLPSPLATICANAPQIALQFVQQFISAEDLSNFREILDSIANIPIYPEYLGKLKDNFSAEFLGYDNWRYKQNKWLLNHFKSDSESRATFGQVINVSDARARVIDRKAASEEFDKWLLSWSSNYNVFTMLGEEGDGKTWAVASWLKSNIESNDNFPGVIFLTSTNAYLTIEPHDLLAQAITNQFRIFDEIYWGKHIKRWMDRPDQVNPFIVLILDGLNERHDFNWRSLLEKLSVSPWKERVAVILTCRTAAWKINFSPLTHLSIQRFDLQSFDDDELLVALKHRGLEPSDITTSLLPLIRKPRYFDLLLRLQDTMAESGDVTIERLLYEDWRDRLSKKSGINFDHDQFQALIRDLAEKVLTGAKALSRRDVEELLPADQRQIIEDLISSGVLTPGHGLGRFKVEKRRLIYGFGLLLKEEVFAARSTSSSVNEAISRLLEPQSDMDIKVAICGAAVFHSLMDQNFTDDGRLRLLLEWIKGRNLDTEGKEDLIAYIPKCPGIYMRLAEIVWADANENSMAQELLMRGFLKWCNNEKVHMGLVPAIERWMGFINSAGYSIQRGVKGGQEGELKQKIQQRLNFELSPGPINYAGYEVTIIEDDGLLRLARVALAIISYSHRRPFIRALSLWSLSRAIMDFPNEYELVSWVLKTTKEDIWNELETEARHLISVGTIVAYQAAGRLLISLGTPEAYKLKRSLPKDLFSPNPLWQLYKENPCEQLFILWPREDYEQCLNREELPAHYIAHNLRQLSLDPDLPVPTNLEARLSILSHYFSPGSLWSQRSSTVEDHNFEQIEPAMCAFAPNIIAEIVKNTIRDAPERNGLGLRQLSFEIKPNLLILGIKEKDTVNQAWNRLEGSVATWEEFDKYADAYLFHAVLWGMSAEEQLKAILLRPIDSLDLIEYEKQFKPLNPQFIDDTLKGLLQVSDIKSIQRVLWFISINVDFINHSSIKYILPYFIHQDPLIRSTTLEIIYRSKEPEAIECVVNNSWSWNPKKDSFDENYWGSVLLSDFGESLTFHQIQTRVHPVYWGYALQRRGLKEEEVLQYAKDLHTIWETIRTKCPPIPINFPLSKVENNCSEEICPPGRIVISPEAYSEKVTFLSKHAFWKGLPSPSAESFMNALNPRNIDDKIERLWNILTETDEGQLAHGNIWFSQRFNKFGLAQIYQLRPDLIEAWLQAVLPETIDSMRLMVLCKSFYEALVCILFEADPSEANKLLNQLEKVLGGINFIDSDTGIPCLYYDLLSSKNIEEVYKILNHKLESSCSDSQLFEIALLAQQTGNCAWLKLTIKKYRESYLMYDQAMAIKLLGYLEDEEVEAQFTALLEKAESWLTSVAQKTLQCWKLNKWAKYWFLKFLEEEDDTRAWAAFALFLKCADRRFCIWNGGILEEFEKIGKIKEKRLKFLELNQGKIKSEIERNEKERGKTFLTEKILENQAWPWMDNLLN